VPWEEPLGAIDRILTAPPIPAVTDKASEPAIGPGLQPGPALRGPAPPPAAKR
jgi:hypothetical protein